MKKKLSLKQRIKKKGYPVKLDKGVRVKPFKGFDFNISDMMDIQSKDIVIYISKVK